MLFHTHILISALLAVSSVLGAPNAEADPCKGLGTGTYTDLAKFRVGAMFNGRNSNLYGSPLVQFTTDVTPGVSTTTFTVSTVNPPSSRRKPPN